MIVELRGRDGREVLLPADVRFEVLRYESAALGGPDWAEVAVHGALEAVLEVLNWLRWRVEIRTLHGTPVWWGFVNEVVVRWGALEVGWSLEQMTNRTSVLYTVTDPDGAIVTEQTAWADDALSQAEYGVKELLLSVGSLDADAALLLRDQALRGAPPATPTVQSGAGPKYAALLRCVGEWQRLGWRYAWREEGRVEFEGSLGHEMPIGWGLTSTTIGFWKKTIQCAVAGLDALDEGMVVTVSGSSDNNGTLTVDGRASGEIESYTATTISFDASDDIMDSAGGLGFLEDGQFVLVAGSTSNNGWHMLDGTETKHVTTYQNFTGNIVTEAAGDTVTLTQGQTLKVTDERTREEPGDTVTLTLHGARTAQRFSLAAALSGVHKVAMKIGKVGAPSDNFVIELRADSSGSPTGTWLATVTLAAAAIGERVEWVWGALDADVDLSAGDYWLVCRRSGSNDAVNYFVLGMVEEAHATCKSWDGSAWAAHVSGWYAPFKVWSEEDIADQIAWLLAQGGGHFTGVSVAEDMNVRTNPYMEGPLTYLDAIEKLIEIGIEDGRRLVAGVSVERLCRVEQAAVSSGNNRLLSVDGEGAVRLLDWAGTGFEDGVLPVGEWVDLVDLPEALTALTGVTPMEVERASWDGRAQALRVEVRGAPRLADLGRIRRG